MAEPVNFKVVLQRGNRVQLPKLVRWRFKLELDQVLKVTITATNIFGAWETFYARMGRDGRITLPKLSRELLQDREQSLTGYAIEVVLEPA